MVHRTSITVAAVTALLMTPVSATAALSPVEVEYDRPGLSDVGGESAGPSAQDLGAAPTALQAAASPVAADDDAFGALPFTGSELALLGLAGAGIALSGAALRRVGRTGAKPGSKTRASDA